MVSGLFGFQKWHGSKFILVYNTAAFHISKMSMYTELISVALKNTDSLRAQILNKHINLRLPCYRVALEQDMTQ